MSSITARRRLLETIVRDGTPLGRFRPLEIGIQSSVRTLNLAQPNIGNPINSILANQVSRAIDKQNQNENGRLIIFHSTQPNMFSKGLEAASQANLKAANRLRKAIQRAQPATIAVYDGVVENAGYSAFADCDVSDFLDVSLSPSDWLYSISWALRRRDSLSKVSPVANFLLVLVY